MKRKYSLIGAALVLSIAAQAAVVSWDGTSTDITSLSANVNATAAGGLWTDAQKAWDTTDMAMAAQGDQAAIKLALSQTQQTHKTAQINHGTDSLFVGGGGSAVQLKTDITPGFSTIYAFDAGVFDATDTLTNLSVTVYERETSDVCSFRWFVVSDGIPYVSATNNMDVGSTKTDYTLADPASETWYAFDGSTNLEAAVGASVGTLTLTNVTYAGIMGTVDAITNPDKNWRGVYLYKFFAETDGAAANEPPVADAQSVEVEKDEFVVITLTGSDPEGSNLTYSVETQPAEGTLAGATNVWIYTPTNGYVGADSFTFTVNDGETNSEPATVSIDVVVTLEGAVWDGGGADDYWTTAANWVGDVLPIEGSNVIFNTPGANMNVRADADFTVAAGTTLQNNTDGGNLIFRIADMGASGELRFATGSTLDFENNGFFTEQGSVNQRVTFEPGATLRTWRYYSNVGFVTKFEGNASGEISTLHCTDVGTSLRTRGALVLDISSHTAVLGEIYVLFDYNGSQANTFSSITVTDATGTLVEGEDFVLDYAYDQGGGDMAVVIEIVAPRLVQWGAAGGQTTITTNAADGVPFPDVYSESSAISSNELIGTDAYYPDTTDRSPVYYGAAGASDVQLLPFDPPELSGVRNEVRDNVNGDIEQIACYVGPAGNVSAMVTWLSSGEYGFLRYGGEIVRFSTEIQSRDVKSSGALSWLVKKDGQWYVSDQSNAFANSLSSFTDNASGLTWSEFTPFGQGGNAAGEYSVGAAAPGLVLTDVSAVGYFVDIDNVATTTNWIGSKLTFFAVEAAGAIAAGSPYEGWAYSYGLFGSDTNANLDYEGDGLENLMEYALGGDPTVDDAAAVAPGTYMDAEGSTNWFYHVYDERTDDPSLGFAVGATPNLVMTPADTNDVEFVGETAESGGFKTVTNRTEASTDAKFIKLEVSQ